MSNQTSFLLEIEIVSFSEISEEISLNTKVHFI